jgi:predicted O-methyltransferase YrrM
MEIIDEQLVERIEQYIEALFVPGDAVLAENLKDAEAAGLPSINVSPNQGKLLYLLARISGAARILEIGTLGGYSTTWLARALPPGGKIVTLELSPANAEVARKNLARAHLECQVEVRVGDAPGTLRKMIAAGEAPFDLIFIDADKPRYVEYLHLALQVSHPGSVILADNLIRNGRVLEDRPSDDLAHGVKAFNDAIAIHPRLESIILPIYRGKVDGLSISRVK